MKPLLNRSGIRLLERGDTARLLSLEETIWKPRGIESLSEKTAIKWLSQGIALGYFERGDLKGYAYGEIITFRRTPPYSTELLAALESYKETRPDPEGNSLHGLSMAVTRPGVGAALLEALIDEARRRELSYFISLARLEGLGKFISENRVIVQTLEEPLIATLYAIQAVSWIDPRLIGEPLRLLEVPHGFPKLRRKDLVVSRFARVGKKLWGVARTSFEDPQSLGYSALVVLPL